jgi:hypothetical protein
MGIWEYIGIGGYVTVTLPVVTIEFGWYIASIYSYIAYLLFRKRLIRFLPYFFDNVVGVSLSKTFNCDETLGSLDAIDIRSFIKPVNVSEVLNYDKMLEAFDAVDNWCSIE